MMMTATTESIKLPNDVVKMYRDQPETLKEIIPHVAFFAIDELPFQFEYRKISVCQKIITRTNMLARAYAIGSYVI